MDHRFAYKDARLRLAISAFAILLALTAFPAHGQQIHQLLYNNSYWADQNLDEVPLQSYALAAFPTTPNDQTHVYFLVFQPDESFHVHQLFYDGASWADEDLTVASGGPGAVNSPVTGFSVDNYQYVYYLSGNGVHQLLYNNSSWVDSNLTALSKSGAYPGFGPLVAFTTSPALHVYYQDDQGQTIGDIHQLYSTDGNSWKDQDLTALTGALPSDRLHSGFNIGNLQYVYYLDSSGHINELHYDNSTWSDLDISALSKIPPEGNSSLAALVIPGTKKMRLYYCSYPKNHLIQLASSNGTSWTSSDLTAKSKAPTPDLSFSSIVAYETTSNNAIHVSYENGNHIHQIFQPTPTTWAHEDLTALGDDFGKVVNDSPLTGFSLGNYQYVFYLAQ
ncbi:MAG TPA: hypothetical protein VKR59_09875 [Terriglobales bacterium]|nr:hypothetical protein [Terriglobales bacterium]